MLTPAWELDRIGLPEREADLATWLTAASQELGVTSRALKWRLVNSKRLKAAARVSNEELADAAANILERGGFPLPFSEPFMTTLIGAIQSGHISAGRASELVGMSKLDLGELAEAYHLERPVEL